MRRTAFVFIVLAVVGLYWACSADAPTPTPPNGHPGGPSPLQIVLFAGDANPTAGACTLIQAIVTLNGVAVPDGTGVSFSTDFGVFSQNGQPVISVVTTKGTAVTALCSNLTGAAFVNATVNAAGSTAKAEPLKIVFQPSAQAVPFFSSCNPSFASATGGTTLTINGGRFPGDATTTRAQFTALGVTREAPVQSVTSSAVTVLTPSFPEVTTTSVPVQITLTFFANTSSPLVLSVPNCFAFGTVGPTTPNITAILPSSGTNSGNTRVSIIGTGFSAPVQVFFGAVEATVVSVSFSQIVVLSPPAFGAGSGNLNQAVNIRVHEVNSGTDANFSNGFRFTPAVQIISFEGANIQRVDLPFTPVTIHGQGFAAPVKVSLAGFVATVLSVSATEILVLPGVPALSGCSDVSGSMAVTNIDTGDSATGQSFTYSVAAAAPRIDSVIPATGDFLGGFLVTITGGQLSAVTSVKFGTVSASFTIVDDGHITATVPASSAITPPVCPPGVGAGTAIEVQTVNVVISKPMPPVGAQTACTFTATNAFTYTHQCVVPP